jgi:tRNA(Ile)-lysidine synthase
MRDRFRKYLADNSMLHKHSQVLLAVSGGIDSMAMTDLFRKENISIAIAHCNFSLRGKESDLDEKFVSEYAVKNNIPFFSIRFATKDYARKHGMSIQMAARELRYTWFEKIRSEHNFDHIAVAHNLNDNIETFLINLGRGTGLSGLTGMKPVSNNIIRPLLFATRSEIETYGKSNGLKFREDSSNADTKYTRNKLRHKVIPVLKEINQSFESAVSETIIRLRQTETLLENYVSSVRDELIIIKGNETKFDRIKLSKLTGNKTLIFELFSPYGLKGSQVKDLLNVIKGRTGSQIFTTSHRILRDREEIIIVPAENNETGSYIITCTEDLVNVPVIKSFKSVQNSKKTRITGENCTAFLDEERLEYPLTIRIWENGDYFIPFGMTSRKKVSDFLPDSKLSLIEKDKVMVLTSNGKIAWIIGRRIDNRFRITPETRKILVLTAVD